MESVGDHCGERPRGKPGHRHKRGKIEGGGKSPLGDKDSCQSTCGNLSEEGIEATVDEQRRRKDKPETREAFMRGWRKLRRTSTTHIMLAKATERRGE